MTRSVSSAEPRFQPVFSDARPELGQWNQGSCGPGDRDSQESWHLSGTRDHTYRHARRTARAVPPWAGAQPPAAAAGLKGPQLLPTRLGTQQNPGRGWGAHKQGVGPGPQDHPIGRHSDPLTASSPTRSPTAEGGRPQFKSQLGFMQTKAWG